MMNDRPTSGCGGWSLIWVTGAPLAVWFGHVEVQAIGAVEYGTRRGWGVSAGRRGGGRLAVAKGGRCLLPENWSRSTGSESRSMLVKKLRRIGLVSVAPVSPSPKSTLFS